MVEDLGGTRLLRRGRSLQASPGETFPDAGAPINAYGIAKYGMPGGPAPGNFFWGRSDF